MSVTKPFETAVNHLIYEAIRPLHLSDSRGEPLPDPKVLTFERHEVPEFKKTRKTARCHHVFAGKCRALSMRVYISRQIEADFWWRKDRCFNSYRRH